MSISLRKKSRISYYEPEEPALDEYLFCESCSDYVFEYCAIHGPLLVIPDDKVQSSVLSSSSVPSAALTIPKDFLHLAPSSIPGAGLGVFSTLTLPRGVRFGPYRGKPAMDARTDYCWQIFNENKPSHVVDASDANSSNWMRYVNCSRRWQEQNLLAYQYQGQLYYRTLKIVPKYTELLVFYGSEFALLLGIDLKQYNASQPHRLKSIVVKPTKIEPTKTTSIDKIEAPSSQRSERNHRQKFICDKCHRCFNSRAPIIQHLQSNCNSPYQCSLCHFKTTSKNFLTKHSKLHDPSRKFICTECKLRFVSRSKLKKHMTPRFHNGIIYTCVGSYKNEFFKSKSIICPICPYKTLRQRDMRRHSKVHTRIRCEICETTFSRQSELLRHKESVICKTTDKPFKCDYCSYRSNQRQYLNRHLKRKHT